MKEIEKRLGKDNYFLNPEYSQLFHERLHLRNQLRKLVNTRLKGIGHA